MTNKMSLQKKQSLTGWAFLAPASLLIILMNFYPMVKAFILSLQTGIGARMRFAGLVNFAQLFKDKTFLQSMSNTFLYLIVQVPVMLVLALILAVMLNNQKLKFRGLFRTLIFLPCATSLVSYSIIFRSMFAVDGFVNSMLMNIGLLSTPINWLGEPATARIVLIIALIWRWTGYNMIFYLSALQNIEKSIYEAASIDGANPVQTFFKITVPLLMPTILVTTIMSTSGTLQLIDESMNLTNGGPANSTLTMSHYIYMMSFEYMRFSYAAAMSIVILLLVAGLSFIQMRLGDKR